MNRKSGKFDPADLVPIWDVVLGASVDFLRGKGLTMLPAAATTGSVSSPVARGSDSAPTSTMIRGREVYLTDSAQFHLEWATRYSRVGAFIVMQSFRDEEPDDRHLSQFFHAEAEVPGTLDKATLLCEQLITHIESQLDGLPAAQKYRSAALGIAKFCESPVLDLEYEDALEILRGVPGALQLSEASAPNILPVGEQHLLAALNSTAIWLRRWAPELVPFYQARDGGRALNADLLMGIGEIAGAGQRHKNAADTLNALQQDGVGESPYEWYLDMKREMPMVTSGFGVGLERFMCWYFGSSDVREFQLFARDRNQIGVP